MISREEDQKITVSQFKGLYSRGLADEVPTDYAQDLLNVEFDTFGHLSTRKLGLVRSLALPYTGVRRFFLTESLPDNEFEPAVYPSVDGAQFLVLDNNYNLHIGNSAANLYSAPGYLNDFSAINMGNRTYISPNNGSSGFPRGRLQVYNSSLGTIRDAAGLAPVQASNLLSAANSTGDASATGTLTSSGTLPSDGDEVYIGIITYTFKNTLTSTPYQVQIGASVAATLLSLAKAINADGSAGTDYSTGTVANASVTANEIGITTSVTVTASSPGSAGNSIYTSAAVGTTLSWANSTLTGGLNSGNVAVGIHKVAVIYQTDTGFWTPPGPKIQQMATVTKSIDDKSPTIINLTSHGMVTGESHRISGINETTYSTTWKWLNDVWHITRIDDDHFSVPLDSYSFQPLPYNVTVTVDAAFTAASVTSDGASGIKVTNIPIGPSYVTQRLILATRANESEFFFVPNVPGSQGIIPDNVTTSCEINFDDTDLTDSADYLFDILEIIPSGSGMCKYAGRLVLCGNGTISSGMTERVLLSNVSDQETFNYVSGYVQVQSENDGNAVRNVFVLRDTLYMSKSTGTFSTEDNAGLPSTWAVTVIDIIIGAFAYGTAAFTTSQSGSDTGDIVLLASKSGLYLFDGVMRRPELTQNIQALWARINYAQFQKVTVAHDPWNHRIYINAPLDTATDPNTLMVADYSEGRDPGDIRWSIWQFPTSLSCIGMSFFGSSIYTQQYVLQVGTLTTAYLYGLTPGAANDDGTMISSYYVPGAFYLGGISCFKLSQFRASGVGKLNLTLYSEDNVSSLTALPLTLSTTLGKELYRQFNFVNEKLNLKIANGNNAGDYMLIQRIDVWGNPLWLTRPALS